MEILGIVGVASITVICTLVAKGIKASPLDANKWLPVICGAMGGILGVVAMNIVPDFPAGDILSAIAIGIVSGLAATGGDQAVKQLAGYYEKKEAE